MAAEPLTAAEVDAAVASWGPDLVRAVLALRDERDAALARAEAAERELAALRPQAQWHAALVGVERVLFDCAMGRASKEDGDRAIARGKTLKHYGALLGLERRYALRTYGWTSESMPGDTGVTAVELSLVERCVLRPFDAETTRRLCALLQCDPGPMLATLEQIEEALR